MRLWHEELISKLPRQQLLGQWRECIALLGLGWGKKHKTVNYVFEYPVSHLFAYATVVAEEMMNRGYKPNGMKAIEALGRRNLKLNDVWKHDVKLADNGLIFRQHDNRYLNECIENLKGKGITI